MDHFLGKPVSYWIELDHDASMNGTQDLVNEIATLRAKVSFYESRIQQLNKFMDANIEIKAQW